MIYFVKKKFKLILTNSCKSLLGIHAIKKKVMIMIFNYRINLFITCMKKRPITFIQIRQPHS